MNGVTGTPIFSVYSVGSWREKVKPAGFSIATPHTIVYTIPMLNSPTGATPITIPSKANRPVFLLLLLSLLSLILTPFLWESWRNGTLSLPLPLLLLLVVILSAGLARFLSRSHHWFPPRLTYLWLLLILLTPSIRSVLDTHFGFALQIITITFINAIGIYYWSLHGFSASTKGFVLIFLPHLILLIWGFFTVLLWDSIGPCHLLSQYRQAGCIRSLNDSSLSPISLSPTPFSTRDYLLSANEATIWLEPLHPLAALVNNHTLTVPYYDIGYLDTDASGTQLHAYELMSVGIPIFFDWVAIGHDIIDMKTGQTIARTELAPLTPTETEAVIEAWLAYYDWPRPVASTDPKRLFTAANGTRQAAIFYDHRIAVWSDPDGELTHLSLSYLPPSITLPTTTPTWSFTPEKPYNCLNLSTDGRLLAGSDNTGRLDIYDIDQQTLLINITLTGDGAFSCPTFSETGRYITLPDDQHVHLLDISTGQTLATLPYANPIGPIDFSSDDRYLVINQSVYEPVLLYDVERAIND